MTSALIDRWPALHRLSDALAPGRWLATWGAVTLGQGAASLALLHLLVDDRESVERLSYLLGFTLLPLVSALITFGGARIVQRANCDLRAFSDGLIAFHATLALVSGVLARGDFFNPTPESVPLMALNELSQQAAMGWDVAGLAQALASTADGLPTLVMAAYGLGLLALLGLSLFKQLTREAAVVVTWASLGLLLTGALPLIQRLDAINGSIAPELRFAQVDEPDIVLRWWVGGDGCLEYAFSGRGARAVWLGELGLAHVEDVNYGRTCAELPLLVGAITNEGQNHYELAGRLRSAAQEAWPVALGAALLLPPLLAWGGVNAFGLALLVGALALGSLAFVPLREDIGAFVRNSGLASLIVVAWRWPWRGKRAFDLAFCLLVIGLTVNVAFPHDLYHYNSGWIGTTQAMLGGHSLMVDVFSQRGWLSLVTLATIFSVVPLHYASLSLLIGILLAAQFIALYHLAAWMVGRWWAALATLAAIGLHMYFSDLRPILYPGFSPLRFGHLTLLALAVAWRLRTGRRSAQWIEWGVLVFCVLWSLDTAAIVSMGYAALLLTEMVHQHGVSRASLLWLLKRVALLAILVGGAFLASSLWLWLSTGQVPRWDIYLGFFTYHQDHESYRSAADFWRHPWWLNSAPQLVALLLVSWRALHGQSTRWRQEAVLALMASGGIVQLYHYVGQSAYVNNHIAAAMLALAYLLSLLPWQQLTRWVALSLGLILWTLATQQVAWSSDVAPRLPLALAMPRLVDEGLRGQTTTTDFIGRRWNEYRQGRQSGDFCTSCYVPQVLEAATLIERYSPGARQVNVLMAASSSVHALLLVRAAQRYPITFVPHDVRVPALVEQILAARSAQVGDMLYTAPQQREFADDFSLQAALLDKLCRQFNFELLETSPHGVMAIRLRENSGQNAICEEHGLYITEKSS
ncbi:MAG: hypothetical protein NZ750_03015 [Anaerolineae bacterium]|nr:hypothetical protein [Anaerolineae bacterium]MDW8172728.1 hypothetical protein [Anaerolineae bacterium]